MPNSFGGSSPLGYITTDERLDADRRRFLALERHWLDQADRQRQLDVAVAAFMAVDEILQVERNVTLLQIAAPAQFKRNVGRDVFHQRSAVLKPIRSSGAGTGTPFPGSDI